jgi:hypothetical protein
MFAIGILGNVFDQVVPVEHELSAGSLVSPYVATASHAKQRGLAYVEYALRLSEAEQRGSACGYRYHGCQ